MFLKLWIGYPAANVKGGIEKKNLSVFLVSLQFFNINRYAIKR